MKGGLAQIIFALKAILETGIELPLVPVIFLNSDEEIGSRTSTRYIRALAKLSKRAFVMEPAMGEEGALKTERKGIGRFTVTVHGKAAHAGLDPEAGASAILELSHVIQTLFALNDSGQGITVNVGTIDGGLQPNVIAAHSQAVVDVRVPTVADGERIERAIHNMQPVTAGVRLTVEGGIGRPSMERTERNHMLWLQARELGKEIGIDLQHVRAGGGSDGNTTSQYTATLDGLGPVGHGAHAEHEFLYLDRTLERAALLALLMLAPAGEGGPSSQ
jgi:glutamate carboxypeptidase